MLVIWMELLKSSNSPERHDDHHRADEETEAERNEGSVSSHPLTVSWNILSSPSFQVHQQSKCPPSGAPTLTTTMPFPSDS